MTRPDLSMTPLHRPGFLLAFFLLAFCISPPVSAFTLSTVSVTPQGYQPPGTPMTVTVVIDFPREGGAETFPSSRDLEMSTALAGARWEPVLVLDEQNTRMPPEKGTMLVLSGMYLSYPSTQDLKVRLILTGAMPQDPSPDKDFLKVQEVDADKNVIATTHVEMPEAPLMIPALSTPPTKKPTTLRTFTPIPTATSPASPAQAGAAVVAVTGIALLAMWRR